MQFDKVSNHDEESDLNNPRTKIVTTVVLRYISVNSSKSQGQEWEEMDSRFRVTVHRVFFTGWRHVDVPNLKV